MHAQTSVYSDKLWQTNKVFSAHGFSISEASLTLTGDPAVREKGIAVTKLLTVSLYMYT